MGNMKGRGVVAALVAGMVVAGTALAGLRLAPVFSDNLVLQRDARVKIWGLAAPDEKVTVTFAGQQAEAQADKTGNWMVRLAPMPASAENRPLKAATGDETIEVRNVLVGEVWVCCGQSNMEMPMWGNNPRFRQVNGDEWARKGSNSLLRLVNLLPIESKIRPYRDYKYKIEWKPASEQSILVYPATAYFFGKELQETLDVPVGLLAAYCGGTTIENWMSPSGLDKIPALKDLAYAVNATLPHRKEYQQLVAKVKSEYTDWMKKFDEALAADGQPDPPEYPHLPAPPAYPKELMVSGWPPKTTMLYNGLVYPLTPMAIRGAIFYQGCQNINDGAIYADKMQGLLNGWRIDFENPEMPFYFVQLAPYKHGGYKLPALWEAQQKFADANRKGVGMAVINDVGDLNDIHPADKTQVGHRLALLALNRTYGRRDIKADSPRLKSARVSNGRYVLTFDHVEEFKTNERKPAFEMAAGDGDYVPAEAEIKGRVIEVFSEKVPTPAKLRFMWLPRSEASLFNEAGLPLGAFRVGDDSDPAAKK